MNKEEIVVGAGNAADFCRELSERFFAQPYGSISKQDLQEFIVHLFDKYGGGFLTRPDIELELALGISQGRVRTLRNNIAHKFRPYDATDSGLLRKLMELPQNRFVFDGGKVSLDIEDAMVRSHLEAVLRRDVGTAFDYSNNRTMVVLNADGFARCIKGLLDKDSTKQYDGLRKSLRKIGMEQFVKKLKGAGTFILTGAVSEAISEGTSTGISTLFAYISQIIGAE